MMHRAAPATIVVLVSSLGLLLLGCPSKDKSTDSGGATSPSSNGSLPPQGAGTGPLANLESAPFVNEVWTSQEGAQLPMIFYTQQNLRMSAGCRNGAGQLSCDAIRQMRSGQPVEIAKRTLTGNVSAGTRVCTKMGNQLVSAHNSVGNEDGFCKFPDGSMVSTGALELYAMRVIE